MATAVNAAEVCAVSLRGYRQKRLRGGQDRQGDDEFFQGQLSFPSSVGGGGGGGGGATTTSATYGFAALEEALKSPNRHVVGAALTQLPTSGLQSDDA